MEVEDFAGIKDGWLGTLNQLSSLPKPARLRIHECGNPYQIICSYGAGRLLARVRIEQLDA